MARTGVLSTAERIRRHLGPGHNMEVAVLAVAIDDSTTTVKFLGTALPRGVQVGVTLGIDTELMRIISLDTSNVQVTVIRGFLDSEAANHADLAQIDIAPRFSMLDIVDAMQSEIDSWGTSLYYTLADTLTVAPSAQTVELPVEWTDCLGVVRCNQNELSSTSDATVVWPELPIRMIRGTASTFDGATVSGILLRFLEPIRYGSVYVVVAMPFHGDGMTTAQDLVTDFHIPTSILDVLEMGAQIRLIANSDYGRGSRQPQDEARRAEETPMGSMVSIEQLGIARYERRKAAEVRRLRHAYPIRIV